MTTTAADPPEPQEPLGEDRPTEGRGGGPGALPRDPRFIRWLLAVTLVGLAWRLLYVVVFQRDMYVWGDAYFYHHGANLLADGQGWINPFSYNLRGTIAEAADHPPLYILYLAGFSAVGLSSPLWHMVASTLLGAATVWFAGLAGRQIGGTRLGLIGAALVAVYPNVWNWDGLLLSETMAILLVTVTVWLGYRFWRTPSLWGGVALGVAVGLASLARAELLLLSVLVILPLCLRARGRTWRERLTWLGASAVACAIVIAPWVAHNLTRFEEPVYLSSGMPLTLNNTNCDATYYGPGIGYWNIQCPIDALERNGVGQFEGDESTRSIVLQREALDYIGNHKSRLPVVVLARWGRVSGLWIPLDQVELDEQNERMTPWVPRAGLAMWYPLAVLAVVGGATLWRRRVTLIPLVGTPLIVAFVVTVFFGHARYRAVAEVPIALLAAVAVERIWAWWRSRGARPADARLTPPSPQPSAADR
jgi:4-amino-4-deoxy-L-arabinose transferase-like glycosyltransferase